jgi:DNA mismatch endonuclease (patch repair protein)
MSKIRSTDSAPEMLVRRLAFGLGYRYRLHVAKLPGKPDLVFPAKQKAIFVHGCFWHQHQHCQEGRPPSSNTGYWGPKLQRNVERDEKSRAQLRRMGWKSLVIWECKTKSRTRLAAKLKKFLG